MALHQALAQNSNRYRLNPESCEERFAVTPLRPSLTCNYLSTVSLHNHPRGLPLSTSVVSLPPSRQYRHSTRSRDIPTVSPGLRDAARPWER